MNKKLRSMLALVLGMVMSTGFVACGPQTGDSTPNGSTPGESVPGDESTGGDVTPPTYASGSASAPADFTVPTANLKKGTYNTTTTVMPSNWCELTYADNNDKQIMNYIGSSFFEYDYKFDEELGGKYKADGSLNLDAVIPGAYTTNFSAATKLTDVTATVDAKWGYTENQKVEGGYAWEITLRNDLKWDDGSAIKAEDFIYSMKEQLNPKFLNMRANTYYDTLRVKRSKAYFYQDTEATYPTIGEQGYESNASAVEAGADIYIDAFDFYNAQGYVDAEGNVISQWVSITDETVYDTPNAWATGVAEDAFSGKGLWNDYFAPGSGAYAGYVEVGGSYESWLGIKVVNTERDVAWDEVGMYKSGEYSFVICLDKSYSLLTDDNQLSYMAAYYMSSLPLVKKDLYESCKIEPEAGTTLWTSNYNTSLETTASWGPYKLTAFQSDTAYTLEKNPNWYGYNMGQYANQYNITKIQCRCVSEDTTKWNLFLSGEVDDATLDTDHVQDYMYSKYTAWYPSSGTFAMQLFGDLSTLKDSGNNNAILAIDEFRQAFSYALNRDDVVEKIWPGSAQPCLGLMNPQYLYDAENGYSYRYTEEAMAALLRAYGFVEEDGLWSDGADIEDVELEDAYEALTGYNPTLAKQLFQTAVTELTTNADKYGYDASKEITIVYGAQVDNAKQHQRVDYLQAVIDGLAAGTALEGKIKIKLDASAGTEWADAFRTGKTQIGFGYGFSGNPFNPFDIVGSFVNPDDSLNYHTYWNTNAQQLTITMPEGDYEGAGETITMGLQNWYYCLNGLAAEYNQQYNYNWDAGKAPVEARLAILAALEEQVIKKSYSVMLIGDYSGSLLGGKFSNFYEDDYNTFMGFGGMRYMVVNYTDDEWTAYVASNNGDLTAEYKKTA